MPADEIVRAVLRTERAGATLAAVDVPTGLTPRGEVAEALALVLFADLLERVPSGAAYVDQRVADGHRVTYDHGALRTLDAPGLLAVPNGVASFARLLEPLGYAHSGTYDLTRLHMTGKVFTHVDHPETVPQYFVSELHVDRLPGPARQVAERLATSATDPLGDEAADQLVALSAGGSIDAVALVQALAACFDRHHHEVTVDEYEVMLNASAELAWIATEGQAFNHATDRVADVDALAAELAHAGAPIKDTVERSASRRVRQTALRADPVVRHFLDGDRTVPGSFFEFISRDRLPDGSLDLAFDASNATGIFGMTR